jgi:hypothetical protein
VAVFNSSGKAFAVVGPSELADVDLSATHLGRGGTSIWSLGGDILVVGTAPVKLGSLGWTLLGARKVEKKIIDSIRTAVGTSLAMIVDGRLLLASAVSDAEMDVLRDATRAPLGRTTIGERSMLVERLEPGPRSALVAATSERSTPTPALFNWLPLFLVGAIGVANVLVALRR